VADIIFAALIILMAYIGAKRGFIRTLMGLSSTLLSLIISMLLYRSVSIFLSASPLKDAVRTYIEKFISENTDALSAFLLQNSMEAASQIVIDAISFAAVIILSKIIIGIAGRALNVISKLPVIHQANSLLGLVIGAVSGILICYIAVGIIGVTAEHSQISKAIENSILVSYLYETNIVTEILK